MRPTEALASHRNEIREIIERLGGRNPFVYGSTSRGDDIDGSDLDILIECQEQVTLWDLAAMQLELEALLNVPVDIATRGSRFRASVLESILRDAIPL